jgi:hypothetical protein
METNWAAEHLQVIRTLMERSAVYRRALAPTMALTGGVGVAAAVAGLLARIDRPQNFALYWLLVGVAAAAGAFLLVRRQALKEGEPLWSPPTRRVTQALLPPLTAGFLLTVMALIEATGIHLIRLTAGWIILYGCALHAAGFFMPRGIKMFGWAFVLGGCGIIALNRFDWPGSVPIYAHAIMGLFFGALHLAYSVYLYFTEQPAKMA